MTSYFIPSNNEFVEHVARSMAFDRMLAEADNEYRIATGSPLVGDSRLEKSFSFVFETLWASEDVRDLEQKTYYRNLARSAISAINLKIATVA